MTAHARLNISRAAYGSCGCIGFWTRALNVLAHAVVDCNSLAEFFQNHFFDKN